MSPKKVNKEERRREVALACFDLIHDVGMKNITVAQVAKSAGIGKGTVYEYFENKEDIIFEIINVHIEYHHKMFLEKIKDVKSTKEKVFHFFDFVMNETEENIRHFNGYREYLSIVLAEENESMCNFNTSCTEFFQNQLKEIIEEGINNEELLPIARNFVDGIMLFEKGVVLMKMTQTSFDAKFSCEKFLNNIFEVIEKKQ
ncbi:MAG: TetR/AcrR family transcriptional regulator [Arcobacter sp.]|uniref:TetR/AcrR family transcriptional regulator n=1 Tax=uncultured Arcobacter sp. TaxID=165434 RepID=UPI000CAD0906|nr:TetR/AcrR family transcriptional regulator [uncultured Arcobacter sp.]PLY09285.1 MAG: TetR/AcrR family transcriptional regulator [Arcobacter sp.]